MGTIIKFSDGTLIEIDATLKQNHTQKQTLTKHKVESGSNVSDHVVKENITFSLEGIISEFKNEDEKTLEDRQAEDELTADLFKIGVDLTTASIDDLPEAKETETPRSYKLWEDLQKAFDTNDLVEVLTNFKKYESMIITGYSIPISADHGDSLFISLDFEEVRFAETKTVKVDKVPKSAIKKNNSKLSEEKKAKANKKLKKRLSGKGHKNTIGLKKK